MVKVLRNFEFIGKQKQKQKKNKRKKKK